MRVIASISNFNDGTSFYRGHGVMSELHKSGDNIHVDFLKDNDVIKIKGADVCFMQRPDQQRDIITMKTVAKLNIPIVVDYDDYLLGVPEHNRYHKIMDIASNDYVTHVKTALSIANMVWVSTDELKEKLSRYNTSIYVIKNAFDNYLYREVKQFNNTKTILWRGSSTHEIDLELFKPQIIELIKENPDFKFIFLIDKFFNWLLDVKNNHKNVELIKAVPVFEYYYKLEQIRPSAVIVPLEDIPFNRCKSDIASLEAISVGALCVAPDWYEWKDLTTHPYKDTKDFKVQTQNVIDTIKAGLVKGVKRPPLRLLSEANKERVRLLQELIKSYRSGL
jgi:hypothetical protein